MGFAGRSCGEIWVNVTCGGWEANIMGGSDLNEAMLVCLFHK